MKKILFGLIAASMVSFAAEPVLTSDPTENTNVFQTGQQGRIAVNGNLSSDVPEVKYVVYASVDGQYDGTAGETWDIPTWVISASTTTPTGVGPNGSTNVSTLPKIYVKRVNKDNNDVMDLGASEIAKFKIQLPADHNITSGTGVADYITNGKTSDFTIFSFFSKATLQKMLTEINSTSTNILSYDSSNTNITMVTLFEASSKGYTGGSYFSFNATNSVFSLSSVTSFAMNTSTSSLADAQKVDRYFATERSISPEVAVLVQIGSK